MAVGKKIITWSKHYQQIVWFYVPTTGSNKDSIVHPKKGAPSGSFRKHPVTCAFSLWKDFHFNLV